MFDGCSADAFLDQLNAEQRAAATYSGETLLILAGAGTGKTTTLCSRAAWLMAQGTPAERILLLTFTRRRARDGDRPLHRRDAGDTLCADVPVAGRSAGSGGPYRA